MGTYPGHEMKLILCVRMSALTLCNHVRNRVLLCYGNSAVQTG
jgi:hypothetical protein